MQDKLFPNIKKMTTIFAIIIFSVTVGVLLLRLTVFSNKVANKPSVNGEAVTSSQNQELDFSMDDRVIFDTARANGSLKIKFPKENKQSIRFTITRKDTQREIYSSKTILPGDKSINIKLSKNDLEKGEYPCIVEITTYELETDKKLETFQQDLTIVIKNDLVAP